MGRATFLTPLEIQLLERVEQLEQRLAALEAERIRPRAGGPSIVSWREAGERLGISAAAARKRLLRARDDGASLRRDCHGVERGDFDRWLRDELQRRPSRHEIVRRALAGGRRGGPIH